MCFYQCVVGAYIFSQLRKIVLYAKLRTSTSGKYVSFTGKNIWMVKICVSTSGKKSLQTKICAPVNGKYVSTTGKIVFRDKSMCFH